MLLFIRSTRNGQTAHAKTEGMDEQTVRRLMTEIGHTEIELISEGEYMDVVKENQD